MKRAIGVVVGLVALAVVAVGVVGTLVLPRQRAPLDVTVEVTPGLLERGTYLVEHVVLCNDCHSERNWTVYGGPPMPPLGGGRECMTRETAPIGVRVAEVQGGFPGVLCIRNITPDAESGIGNWTDGEIIRATREGVDHAGRGLFPMMPYFIYRDISDRDAAAIVAYMRNLEPVRADRPERDIDFPLSLLIQLFPEPLPGPVPHPDEANPVEYGEYLATIARCGFCHTPRQGRGKEGIPGKAFAGGVPFVLGGRVTLSKNLTPDPSGIGGWTREAFIQRFRRFGARHAVTGPAENTLMNWSAYAGMTDEDLGAIYAFLSSLTPVTSTAGSG